ncbi:ATP-binding protein [Streptomyces sp. NPDC056224]|uniref:ATP-binding protein n=1 Tax=Streptomyces sp. NPDC056224 TaxID=3345750 RepID=UPI0035E2959B
MSGLRAARHAPSRHAVTGPARQIRPQLVRAAVLPTLAAGLSGAAAVIFTLQLGGGAGERDARLWPVLTGCALLVLGALAAALLGAQRAAKAVRDRCEALRRSSARGRQELRTAADRLERGETPPRPVRGGPTGPPLGTDPAGVDEFWLLSQELRGAREQAHTALVRLAGPAAPSDSERKVEVFVNLARRLQSLVHREISLLDGLEDTVEDPDLLKELFHVDHLATRIRRHAENLAVLGGAASRRQWTRPIDLSEVLRSSVAEVEQYTRVKVVPPAGGSVRGHAVADVVHLLAELVENATVFSAPDTDVVLRAERVTAGIAVEVEDRGLGMPAEEQHRMNALLGDPDQFSVRHLLADGRIGLFVVSALARRHGIAVELKSNIYGGVLAVLVLPQELLGAEAPSAADAAGGSRATSWGTGESAAVPPLEPVRVTPPRADPEPLPGRGAPTGAGAGAWCAGAAGPAPAVNGPAPVPRAAPDPARGPRPQTAPGPGTAPGAPREPAAGIRSGAAHAHAPAREAGIGVQSGAPHAPGAGISSGIVSEPGAGSRIRPGDVPEWESGPGTRFGQSGPGPAARPKHASTTPVGVPKAGSESRPGGGPGRGAGRRSESESSVGVQPGGGTAPGPGAGISSGIVSEPGAGSGIRPGDVPEWESGPGTRFRQSGPGPAARPAQAPTTPVDGPEAGSGSRPGSEPGRGAGILSEAGDGAGMRFGGAPARASSAAPLPVRRAGGGATEAVAMPLPAPRAGDGASAPAVGAPRSGPAGPWGEPGTTEAERPPLPRRRAQEHLAPQLREAPAPRRSARTGQPVHDPGLMAAFQRGFGLAQSEKQV